MDKRFGAIILAAGLSSRMQAFKPLLEIRGKTFIEQAIGLFQDTGVEQIITVVGHRAEHLIPILASTSSEYVINHNFSDGMFSSVKTGVERRDPALDAFYILPVDIPLVLPSTIRSLAAAFQTHSSVSVCYPLYLAKRGHPPLLSSRIAGDILTYEGQDGLRGLLRNFEPQALNVSVDDPFIHMDADSRQDLIHLQSMYFDNRHRMRR